MRTIRRLVSIPFGLAALMVLMGAAGLSMVALMLAGFAKWVAE